MSQSEKEAFAVQASVAINKLPFYNYLGICFAERKYRNAMIFDTTFTNDRVWDGKNMEPGFWRKVEEVLSAVDLADQTALGE